MIQVSAFTAAEEEEFTLWLLDVPGSLMYYTPSFQRFLRAVTGGDSAMLLARAGGRIAGALPYLSKRDSRYGVVINSQPWYGSHGGCVLSGESADAARSALLGEYRLLVQQPSVLSATMILSPDEEEHRAAYESAIPVAARDNRIGQITRLPSGDGNVEARLEGTFAQKTRNLVRKARKQGFREIVTDDDWAWRFLHETHEDNMTAVGGKAKPRSHFAALREHIPARMRRLSVAMLQDEPVAALLLILFNGTVEYVTPAVRVEHRSRQPLSYLIWEAMRQAVSANYERWNWGGTWITQSTLQHFKAGWGARDLPYSYLVSASPERVRWLQQHLDDAADAFPYFYLYPRALVADRTVT